MTFDSGMIAVSVTVLIAIIGLAASLGALSQKVKGHDREINANRLENREDHRQIFCKLDEINKYIRNGR